MSELAERAGIATATLVRLERNAFRDPGVSLVLRIARTLDMTLDDLVAL